MSPSRMISLAEAVSWFAWDQRFTAGDFLAADRLKVSAGEILLYKQNLKEGKMLAASTEALEIYQRAVAADKKILKRIKEASGHSYTSKAGRNAAKKELDAAFAVIVEAIQAGRVESARGQRDTDNKGARDIPWKWFDKNPELTASYEMNILGLGTLIDTDGNEVPDLRDGWTDVEFELGEIEGLRGETRDWPHKHSEHAATDEPSAAPDLKGGATAPPDEDTQSDAKTRKAKVGRPSRREEIKAAYEELAEAGEINFNGPKAATYEPIRKRVRSALDDPNLSKGLGDEVIRDIITPLFEAGKAKQQSAST